MDMKWYRKILAAVFCVAIFLTFALMNQYYAGQLKSQQLAQRWSKEMPFTQITCFFSEEAKISNEQVIPMEAGIKTALSEAAIDGENETARTWIDAYSATGTVAVDGNKGSINTRAYGVSRDFFLFHPLELQSGGFFGVGDDNIDQIVLDENAAWQLFGAVDVAGMTVEVNGHPFLVCGVVSPEQGVFSVASGAEEMTIYIPYEALSLCAEDVKIDTYELLVENPVKDFGVATMKKVIGVPEENYELVENSTRFSLANRWNILRNFGVRSMSRSTIIYPYWENRAKAYEDVSASLLIFELLFLIYPILLLIYGIWYGWKKKEIPMEKMKQLVSQLYQKYQKERNVKREENEME